MGRYVALGSLLIPVPAALITLIIIIIAIVLLVIVEISCGEET